MDDKLSLQLGISNDYRQNGRDLYSTPLLYFLFTIFYGMDLFELMR